MCGSCVQPIHPGGPPAPAGARRLRRLDNAQCRRLCQYKSGSCGGRISKLDGSVADAGNLFSESKTISASGVKDGPEGNISNGYGIFQANSLAEATA